MGTASDPLVPGSRNRRLALDLAVLVAECASSPHGHLVTVSGVTVRMVIRTRQTPLRYGLKCTRKSGRARWRRRPSSKQPHAGSQQAEAFLTIDERMRVATAKPTSPRLPGRRSWAPNFGIRDKEGRGADVRLGLQRLQPFAYAAGLEPSNHRNHLLLRQSAGNCFAGSTAAYSELDFSRGDPVPTIVDQRRLIRTNCLVDNIIQNRPRKGPQEGWLPSRPAVLKKLA